MSKSTLLLTIVGTAIGASPAALAQDDARHSGMFRYPDVSKNDIVFVYANDLWVVDRKGGQARPLASPAGQERFPRFSPDGKSVAFEGNYEGDRDIYTVSVDGSTPYRVTHHPGNERLLDWNADGSLLFSFNALSGTPAQQRIFTVSPEGGLPEALNIPYGAVGAINDDGDWLAYTTDSRDFRTWKRYRGGLATDIWLYNESTNESKKITDWEGTDTSPMWHKDKVYYLSDEGDQGRLNIWSYDTRSGNHKQITKFEDNDVKFPSMGPGSNGNGEIVFQLGSKIHLLDLRNERVSDVEITIPGARESLRPKTVNAMNLMASGGISSTGKRGVVEARGDIWTVPAENGPVRQMTSTSEFAERSPSWSPSGKWIAYFSDQDGEYELYITQSDGKGETRQLTDGNKTYFMSSQWSPDSKSILVTDKAGIVTLIDVESGDSKVVLKDPWSNQPNMSWSKDSKWIAYDKSSDESLTQAIWIYDTETGEHHKVTSGFFSDSNPAFSRDGEYLYYSSNRVFTSPTYEDVGSTFIYNQTGTIIAVPLNSEVENPRLLTSDEEEWEEETEEAEDTAAEDSAEENADAEDATDEEADAEEEAYLDGFDTEHDLWGKWEGAASGFAALGLPTDEVTFTLTIIIDDEGNISGTSEAMGETDDLGDSVSWNADTKEFVTESSEQGMTTVMRGTVNGDEMTGTWTIKELGVSGSWSASRTSREISQEELGAAAESSSESDDEPIVIDFDGFEARGVQLQIGAGNFSNLASNDKGNLLYLRSSPGAPPSLKLYDITAENPSEKTVLGMCMGFDVSGDGKKLIAATPQGFGIVSASAGQSVSKPLNPTLRKSVDLQDEWRGLVRDAWRRFRDFFYVENMHGVDWDAVLAHYLPMVDDAVSREDVSYIIGEMISELNVGHAYYSGGDTDGQPSTNVGMLGADYEVFTETVDGEEHSGFRFAKIYHGAPWDSDARNPLTQPGIEISEGDILTSVNGVAVDTSKDPWAAFIGLANTPTTITVVSSFSGDEETINEREFTIKPMWSETNLRFRNWIEDNRAYVEEASGGQIGYIYVPNTGVQGQNELFRQFYGQAGKAALLIDERWNGGGQIPNRFIELLNRPRTNYWYRRDGKDWPWPYDSHQGPKAMLINGNAGSGGDMFPWLFKHHGLGKLIGTRTWGGLVGISGVPSLIDGGNVSVPNFGFYETDGTWGIEGHGVDPDIEVIADPAKMRDGADPQLDTAIEHLIEEIKVNGYKPPRRPAEPVRTEVGISEDDK
jgi:tricorn protease-like protein/C-terminal processing protease CtpA/Prc